MKCIFKNYGKKWIRKLLYLGIGIRVGYTKNQGVRVGYTKNQGVGVGYTKNQGESELGVLSTDSTALVGSICFGIFA